MRVGDVEGAVVAEVVVAGQRGIVLREVIPVAAARVGEIDETVEVVVQAVATQRRQCLTVDLQTQPWVPPTSCT
jgi:hypothetical protein